MIGLFLSGSGCSQIFLLIGRISYLLNGSCPKMEGSLDYVLKMVRIGFRFDIGYSVEKLVCTKLHRRESHYKQGNPHNARELRQNGGGRFNKTICFRKRIGQRKRPYLIPLSSKTSSIVCFPGPMTKRQIDEQSDE